MNESLPTVEVVTGSQPETPQLEPSFDLEVLKNLLNNESESTDQTLPQLKEQLKAFLILIVHEDNLPQVGSEFKINVNNLPAKIKKIVEVGLPGSSNLNDLPIQVIPFLKFLALTMFLISYNNVGGKLLSRPEILELAFHLSSNDFYRNLGSEYRPIRRYTRILELLRKINLSSADINFRDPDVAEIIKKLRIGGSGSDLVANLVANPFTVFTMMRYIINEDMSKEDESVRLARLAKKRQKEELVDKADSNNKVVLFPKTLPEFFAAMRIKDS